MTNVPSVNSKMKGNLHRFSPFSAYLYSTRCDLIGHGPCSRCKPVKSTAAAEAEVDSFLIFSILRILPLRFRTAENTSNFRRNTDKYGRLAILLLFFRHAKGTIIAVRSVAQIGETIFCGQLIAEDSTSAK